LILNISIRIDEEKEEDCNAPKYKANIGQRVKVTDADRIYGCEDGPIYALRDIKSGEELRMEYTDFSEPEGWEAMGLHWYDVE